MKKTKYLTLLEDKILYKQYKPGYLIVEVLYIVNKHGRYESAFVIQNIKDGTMKTRTINNNRRYLKKIGLLTPVRKKSKKITIKLEDIYKLDNVDGSSSVLYNTKSGTVVVQLKKSLIRRFLDFFKI
jgi:hypothetical protein